MDLTELQRGQPGLTKEAGAFLAQAGAVGLESHGHRSGGLFMVTGALGEFTEELRWQPATAQTRRTWNDRQAATEYGAVGIAILLLRQRTEHAVLQRARKGTGCDYWLGPPARHPFQHKARLEVSGLLTGSAGAVRTRVRQKLEQTKLSARTLPAYVVVVAFSRPLCAVEHT